MKAASIPASIAVAWLLLSVAAGAATVHTPPLTRGTSGTFICNVANASTKTREVVVAILDPQGDEVNAPVPASLSPGQLFSVSNAGATGGRSCRVEVKGPRKSVRVSLYVVDANGDPTAAVSGQ